MEKRGMACGGLGNERVDGGPKRERQRLPRLARTEPGGPIPDSPFPNTHSPLFPRHR